MRVYVDAGMAALKGTPAVPKLVTLMNKKNDAPQKNAGIALSRLAKDGTGRREGRRPMLR